MEKKNNYPGEGAPIQNKTIDLELARIRVSRWLNAMALVPQFKENPALMPRAIFISLDDINELIAAYPEKELSGIRVYFGIAGEDNPGPASVDDMRGMIVPVLKAGPYRPHTDYIVKTADPNDTSIYDFTAPCPVFCDKQSELYVPYEDTAAR
jgi:hypothetical protein